MLHIDAESSDALEDAGLAVITGGSAEREKYWAVRDEVFSKAAPGPARYFPPTDSVKKFSEMVYDGGLVLVIGGKEFVTDPFGIGIDVAVDDETGRVCDAPIPATSMDGKEEVNVSLLDLAYATGTYVNQIEAVK